LSAPHHLPCRLGQRSDEGAEFLEAREVTDGVLALIDEKQQAVRPVLADAEVKFLEIDRAADGSRRFHDALLSLLEKRRDACSVPVASIFCV